MIEQHLGMDIDRLEKTLTHRRITALHSRRKSVFSKPCSLQETTNRRDCLAKLLYSRYIFFIIFFYSSYSIMYIMYMSRTPPCGHPIPVDTFCQAFCFPYRSIFCHITYNLLYNLLLVATLSFSQVDTSLLRTLFVQASGVSITEGLLYILSAGAIKILTSS